MLQHRGLIPGPVPGLCSDKSAYPLFTTGSSSGGLVSVPTAAQYVHYQPFAIYQLVDQWADLFLYFKQCDHIMCSVL